MDLGIDSEKVNQNEETNNATIVNQLSEFLIFKRSNTPTTSNQNKTDINNLIRPYICETCGREFRFKSWLDRHKTIHTGEKHFECVSCSKRYSRKQILDMHMLAQHKNDKGYEKYKNLYNIGVTHTCGQCHKKFKIKTDLLKHKRMHDDERPFECKYCGLRFTHRRDLNKHKNKEHPSDERVQG
ncbi:PREDICTED: zinc finger protein 60-like [Cyphomyrmex costatus]|uniref:zinc finger protein 60-like n=1 Tax=Cyphomyrmex costatus TaxID=456900 RepID=UPI0008523B55|nr:PREDICTED: zinc finger protein 60-like [Cyphomyrmex costatus]